MHAAAPLSTERAPSDVPIALPQSQQRPSLSQRSKLAWHTLVTKMQCTRKRAPTTATTQAPAEVLTSTSTEKISSGSVSGDQIVSKQHRAEETKSSLGGGEWKHKLLHPSFHMHHHAEEQSHHLQRGQLLSDPMQTARAEVLGIGKRLRARFGPLVKTSQKQNGQSMPNSETANAITKGEHTTEELLKDNQTCSCVSCACQCTCQKSTLPSSSSLSPLSNDTAVSTVLSTNDDTIPSRTRPIVEIWNEGRYHLQSTVHPLRRNAAEYEDSTCNCSVDFETSI